jgi:hypothetical protein
MTCSKSLGNVWLIVGLKNYETVLRFSHMKPPTVDFSTNPTLRIKCKRLSLQYKKNIMEKPTPKDQPKWRNSVAKKILTNEILEGNIGNQTPSELYDSNDEFKKFPRRNFIANMSKLQQKLEINESNARIDGEAIEHDRKLHPRGEKTAAGYPFWDTSAAKTLLETELSCITTNKMKPIDLWMSRPEYQEFPLKVFRCHVNNMKRKTKASAYWENKNNRKNKYK